MNRLLCGSAFFLTLLCPLLLTAQTPIISTLSPTSGLVGAVVTIIGTDFGSSVGTVTFNGKSASLTSWSATKIVVSVPGGATTGNVVVTASGQASNAVVFTVTQNAQTSAKDFVSLTSVALQSKQH